MLKMGLQKLMQKQNLNTGFLQQILEEILHKDANELQTALFLALLHAKSETETELITLIETLKSKMVHVHSQHKTLDIVGTGGDGAHTINISTGSAILAASCGVKVVKHGNRAVSSLAGSADVLEALGIKIHASPEHVSCSINEIGIGFCFSPHFHPHMQKLSLLRKQMGIATTFNLIGPLLNPASPDYLLLGAMNGAIQQLFATTLKKLGTMHAVVAHGHGLDEISCLGACELIEVTHGHIKNYDLDPSALGLSFCQLSDLQGGDAKTNAELLKATFLGQSTSKIHAIAETLILNAAVALKLYGLHDSIKQAVEHAKESLLTGKAFKLLQNWIEFSHDTAS